MSAIFTSEACKHASRLKDQVVVVTGAASGIGREVVLLFAGYGCAAREEMSELDEGALGTRDRSADSKLSCSCFVEPSWSWGTET